MPAKKKPAAKKAAAKSTSAKKAPAEKAPAPAPKKAAPAAKAPKKVAVIDTPEAPAHRPKRADEVIQETPAPVATKRGKSKAAPAETTPAEQPKVTASELLKRQKHHTPAVFKIPTRKQAPVVFTLDEVRDILRKRKPESPAAASAPADTPLVAKKDGSSSVMTPAETAAEATAASRHGAASLADILGFKPKAKADVTSASIDAHREVPKKWQKYHEMLIELRREVRHELNEHSSDTLKKSQKEDTGDLATSADAGSDNFDRDFALSLLSSEQETLKEIEAALERIYNGTYGVCEITGKPISAERLEAVPFTRYSLEGQRQYESNSRRRVQRAGAFINEADETVSFGEDDSDES